MSQVSQSQPPQSRQQSNKQHTPCPFVAPFACMLNNSPFGATNTVLSVVGLYLILSLLPMCQCMVCGCIWVNYCGVCCGGVHEGNLLCSYWLCKPADLRLLDPACCHICACDGSGYNCLWQGCICCAPSYVIEWSGLRSAGMSALAATSPTVVINNPGYVAGGGVTMQAGPGYVAGPGVGMAVSGPGVGMAVSGPGVAVGGPGYYGGGANVTMNVGPTY